jgi:hypothetical protein
LISGLSPEALYVQLGRLLAAVPDLGAHPGSNEVRVWLARAEVLVMETGDAIGSVKIRQLPEQIGFRTDYRMRQVEEAVAAVRRAFEYAEMRAPSAVQGAFIPAGGAFDAFVAVSRVFGTATVGVLVMDPYADAKILTDFAVAVPTSVSVRILADTHGVKNSLARRV